MNELKAEWNVSVQGMILARVETKTALQHNTTHHLI